VPLYRVTATATMQKVALLTHILILAGVLQGQSGFVLGSLAPGYLHIYSPFPSCVYGYRATCEKIAKTISSASEVFYPGEIWVILAAVVACHRRPGF
jgi:hypothetical protein